MSNPSADPTPFLQTSYHLLRRAVSARDTSTPLPPTSALHAGRSSLPSALPEIGRGQEDTIHHILTDIVPALNNASLSPRFFGFVTGGVLPVSEAADNVVSALDQNVQVHLPHDTICTDVEDAALRLVVDLLGLGGAGEWPGRTFTTGATGSNVLGLTCGREAVVGARLEGKGTGKGITVAKVGLLDACLAAGVGRVQVLTSAGHSSLVKAASIVGIGHDGVRELPLSEEEPWRLDLDAVERELKRSEEGVASIISVSAGEVNTGRFATNALDMPKLRSLADKYGAWIHVDGAFGIFARVLPQDTDEFLTLRAQTAGLELADSITVDGHKILNVPYDNGIFLCRHPTINAQAFSNPNAAYLATDKAATIQSPLNIGLENSRRFRALPVYAALVSEGRTGIAQMVVRMAGLARRVAEFVRDSPDYDWLPDESASLESTFIIVLFRAKDRAVNEELVKRINASGRMYVSGTAWKGEKAVRLAVSNWRVDVERDFAEVKSVLESVVKS
ncbi:PLP-dependent transferase [Coniochaeta ligniaria NRRL 30616]|uniref:PLP-dependent transferase n=1 Tax=Coniochaeta ligniaria NRRL 30616 TaxID=1408157 RepID=A0A1J7IPC4_9PEZI|nr:PLP-dependent transferase [Coniochaeta ligniaria NRRL 30616]